LGAAGGPAPALAIDARERLSDPALEARARSISAGLRCVVCQNQSIDDSDAPLAHDLRHIVRERLTAGDTDKQVVDFVVARYGEFVLLRPRLSLHTLLLWLAPALLFGGGLLLAYLSVWKKARAASEQELPAPLSPHEQAQLDEILRERG
jgi:cytochrome c-type biogenesis protein CcmH